MALPPLELFSLKKRPPCCRVASSRFRIQLLGDVGAPRLPEVGDVHKKLSSTTMPGEMLPMQEYAEGSAALRRKRHLMSDALNTALQVMIVLLSLAILICPSVLANDVDLDANDSNHTHIR